MFLTKHTYVAAVMLAIMICLSIHLFNGCVKITQDEDSEKTLTLEQLHKETYARELQAERESYERRQQLAIRLGMQTDPPPTIDELEAMVEGLEALAEIREAQIADVKIEKLTLNGNSEKTTAFIHWFKGYAVEQQARFNEVESLLQTPDFSVKKFIELVPNLDDRLHYIEIFREITNMDELSTQLAKTPKSFRDSFLTEIKIRWIESIGEATLNRLISETNRKAQD